MSAQCRPKPQPATSCHERPPKYPVTRKKKSSPKEGTLEDIGRLRYPIDTLLFHARCPPRPSAGRSRRTGSVPSAAPPPAGTVNLKSPQLQKPHVPSTLVRKCARSKSRTGRSCIDARRIEYIFLQRTRAMGTRECEQSARRVISITQLAVARPGKEASRKERPGPPERRPHSIRELRLSGDRTPPLNFRKNRTRPTWQDLNGQKSLRELSCNST